MVTTDAATTPTTTASKAGNDDDASIPLSRAGALFVLASAVADAVMHHGAAAEDGVRLAPPLAVFPDHARVLRAFNGDINVDDDNDNDNGKDDDAAVSSAGPATSAATISTGFGLFSGQPPAVIDAVLMLGRWAYEQRGGGLGQNAEHDVSVGAWQGYLEVSFTLLRRGFFSFSSDLPLFFFLSPLIFFFLPYFYFLPNFVYIFYLSFVSHAYLPKKDLNHKTKKATPLS